MDESAAPGNRVKGKTEELGFFLPGTNKHEPHADAHFSEYALHFLVNILRSTVVF